MILQGELSLFFDSVSGYSYCWSLSFQIAKVEKLKPLEVELRRLEDLSESIVNDFAYMKRREEEMRDTNGKHHQSSVWAARLWKNHTFFCLESRL